MCVRSIIRTISVFYYQHPGVVSPVAGVPGPRLFVPVIFTHLDSGEVSTPTAGTASQIPGTTGLPGLAPALCRTWVYIV